MKDNTGTKLVSVIIPTYNRALMLCECVNSILKSTYSNLEIIIVDNHSTDHTKEIISQEIDDPRIKVIALEKNLMAAGGRNEGIKNANGDYLLFVDNDNIVYEDMIERLVREMEKDSNVGLVGPLSINKNEGDLTWLVSGSYNFFTSKPKAIYSKCKVENLRLKEKYETSYSPNIMMVSRKAIEMVGGFDISYYAMYEEADFGYRIRKAGFKEYIVTGARTYHMGYIAEGEQKELRMLGINFPKRAYHFAKNRSVFMKKYAKWYQLLCYYFFFIHVYTIYYTFVAIKNGRIDIAKEWIKGTIRGVMLKTTKETKIEI